MDHFCLLSCDELEQEIALAELWALTGVVGNSRVVTVGPSVDVTRAAHVSLCAESLAEGADPAAIAEAISGRGLEYERFRITLLTLPPRPDVDARQVVVDVADHVSGTVDLSEPLNELVLVGSEGHWRLGRVVSRSDKSFRAHEHKPHMFSSSLPARLSRAMVNLVGRPGDLIIDPCCGVGSILLEAWACDMRAVGADLNPKLTGMTRENLLHFGRPPWVCAADAASLGVRGDAVVTDFPYGPQSAREEGLYERLLANFPSLAPRLSVVVACEIDDLLAQAGYRVLHQATIPKGRLFERRVYVAEVRRDDA